VTVASLANYDTSKRRRVPQKVFASFDLLTGTKNRKEQVSNKHSSMASGIPSQPMRKSQPCPLDGSAPEFDKTSIDYNYVGKFHRVSSPRVSRGDSSDDWSCDTPSPSSMCPTLAEAHEAACTSNCASNEIAGKEARLSGLGQKGWDNSDEEEESVPIQQDDIVPIHVHCLSQLEGFLQHDLSSKGLIVTTVSQKGRLAHMSCSGKSLSGPRGQQKETEDEETLAGYTSEDQTVIEQYFAGCEIFGFDIKRRLAKKLRRIERLYKMYCAESGAELKDAETPTLFAELLRTRSLFPQDNDHVAELARAVVETLERKYKCSKPEAPDNMKSKEQKKYSAATNDVQHSTLHNSEEPGGNRPEPRKFSSPEAASFSKIVWRVSMEGKGEQHCFADSSVVAAADARYQLSRLLTSGCSASKTIASIPSNLQSEMQTRKASEALHSKSYTNVDIPRSTLEQS
jgi:hypothetical protein